MKGNGQRDKEIAGRTDVKKLRIMRSSYAPSAKETHRSVYISLVNCLHSNLTGCFKREVETTDRFHESCRCCVPATKNAPALCHTISLYTLTVKLSNYFIFSIFYKFHYA